MEKWVNIIHLLLCPELISGKDEERSTWAQSSKFLV